MPTTNGDVNITQFLFYEKGKGIQNSKKLLRIVIELIFLELTQVFEKVTLRPIVYFVHQEIKVEVVPAKSIKSSTLIIK